MVLAKAEGGELPVKCVLASVALLLLLSPTGAMACAVCFGDPDSAMGRGATAGILLLLGVIGTVLLSIIGVTLFWVHRARQLQRVQSSPRYSMGKRNGSLAHSD